MNIEYIDITSYRGISSDAEHFYARAGEPSWVQEMLLTDTACKPNSGVSYVNGEELRHFPSREEAEALWEKDHGKNHALASTEWKETEIRSFQEKGTIRFPSLAAVIRAARKRFPDAVLCFSYSGSVKEFASIVLKISSHDKEFAKELENLIKEKDK